MELCKLHVLELFNILPDTNITKINDFFHNTLLYKGYFHRNKEQIDELLIVYEYKNQDQVQVQHQWTTIHEIVNTQKRINIPIPIINKWFFQFSELYIITDIYDVIIDTPYVLYTLDVENTDQIKSPTFHSKTINKSKKTILPSFIYHPIFGMKFFFSNHYVGESEDNTTDNEIRYVVFITKTLYILDDISEYKVTTDITNYNSIYFQQNGEPIWAITSVDFFTEINDLD